MEAALKQQRASLEKQRQAIHTQLGGKAAASESAAISVEQFITPLAAPNQNPLSQLTLNQPDCPPLDSSKINELVSAAAQKQSLDPALLKAVIKQESGFKPCVISVKGAQGLMQLMPTTARELHVNNAFDPVQNVQAGAAYLKQLLDRYRGDLRLALVGYNAGPVRADQGKDTPYPLETQNYVTSILADLGIGQSDAEETKEDLAPDDDSEEQTEPAASKNDPKPALSTTPARSPDAKLRGPLTKP